MYASNSTSYGTALFNGVMNESNGNAAGNATMGVFNAGCYENKNDYGQFPLNIYMYSTNSVTTGVSLSVPSGYGGATGNDVYGVFTIGSFTNTTDIYNYSNNTVNASANLTNTSIYTVGTSNHNPGVNSQRITNRSFKKEFSQKAGNIF